MKVKTLGCVVLLASVMVLSLASVPEIASAYTPTEEDIEVIDFVKDQDEKMVNALEDVTNYYDEQGLSSLLTLEEVINWNKGCAGINLFLINQYVETKNLSSELDPLIREFCSECNEYIEGYDELEIAMGYYKDKYFVKYEEHMDKSVEHFERAASHHKKVQRYLEEIEQGKAPKTPGFRAIFAICSLLAVAYLVLRRRG